MNNFQVLIEQLSHMVRESMPAHASEMISEQQSSPQVLLIHGIMNTGDGDYQLSIDRFKQALVSTCPIVEFSMLQIQDVAVILTCYPVYHSLSYRVKFLSYESY